MIGQSGQIVGPNLEDKISQLMAWHKCQQAEPNFFCQLTAKNCVELSNWEVDWHNFYERKNQHFHWQNHLFFGLIGQFLK
jgi:hypothetical protein